MDNLSPEISPPKPPAENAGEPVVLWRGNLSLLTGFTERSHLQVGPMNSPGGIGASMNAPESSSAITES